VSKKYLKYRGNNMDDKGFAGGQKRVILPELSIHDFERKGDKLGSNEGGTYESKVDKSKFYIKFPKEESTVKNEVLAAKLYELFGVKVADVYFIRDESGKLGIASKWEETFLQAQNAQRALRKDVDWSNLPGVKSGFIVDALLANWDVVGLEYDNIGTYKNKIGKQEAFRIDTGGALLYRAKGEAKGTSFTDNVEEDLSLRGKHPKFSNHTASALFSGVTDGDIAESLRKIAKVNPQDIESTIRTYYFDDKKTQDLLISKLSLRLDDLTQKYIIQKNVELCQKVFKGFEVLPGDRKVETTYIIASEDKDAVTELSKVLNDFGIKGKDAWWSASTKNYIVLNSDDIIQVPNQLVFSREVLASKYNQARLEKLFPAFNVITNEKSDGTVSYMIASGNKDLVTELAKAIQKDLNITAHESKKHKAVQSGADSYYILINSFNIPAIQNPKDPSLTCIRKVKGNENASLPIASAQRSDYLKPKDFNNKPTKSISGEDSNTGSKQRFWQKKEDNKKEEKKDSEKGK
jgi:hypothetical protein